MTTARPRATLRLISFAAAALTISSALFTNACSSSSDNSRDGSGASAGESGGAAGKGDAGSSQMGGDSGTSGTAAGGLAGGGRENDAGAAGANDSDAGTAGVSSDAGSSSETGGSSGTSGSAGSSGHSGSSTTAGSAGSSGSNATAGSAGTSGSTSAGTAGAGGSGNTAGATSGAAGSAGSTTTTPGDIALAVIANPDPSVSGDLVLYELKVTNTGGSTLTNVVLSDTTQNAAHAYVPQITGGGTCGNQVDGYNYCNAGTIISWPAFTLAAGQTQTVWLSNYVLSNTANGTVIHNTATVNFAGKTVTQTRNVLVDTTVPLPLGITEDVNPALPGGQVTYTVTVGNTGTQTLPVSNAGVITATIPTGTTFVSATSGGSNSNGKVQWNVGSVDPGQTQHYSYTVMVGGSVASGAFLVPSAELFDSSTSLTRALALTEVRAVTPLSLEVVSNSDPAAANELVAYQLKVTNTSSGTLTNVVLSDVTQNDARGAYVPQITGGGGCGNRADGYSYCNSGTIITWPGFTLAPGQTQTVWFNSTIASAAASGTLIRNQARLTYTGGMVVQTGDLAVNNKPYLRVGLTEDHNPVAPGDQVGYTVTVGNTATASLPVSNAGVLTATVPMGTTFVSATGGGTNTNGTVQWNIGSVAPGATQHYSYKVTVGAGLANGSSLLPSTAILDGTTSVARATSLTEVRAAVPLKLVAVVNPDPVPSNGLVWYQYQVSNTSGSTLTNVILSDTTQNALRAYQPEITGGGSCGTAADGYNYCNPGTSVSWPAFTLTSGQTQTVWLTGTIPNGTTSGTVIRNQARLAYAGGMVTAANDLTVDNTPLLHLGMTADHHPVHPGDKVVYTLTVGNTGTQALPVSSAGVLTAKVPIGTSYFSSSTGGVNTNGDVQWSIGFVNPGSVQKYSFTVTAGGTLADGSLLESAAHLLDSTASLARASTSTEVRAAPPLTLDVSVTPDPVAPNALAVYTFLVTNSSGATLTNVILSDVTLNAGSAYQPSMTGGGTCGNQADGYNYCNPGTIVSWPAATLTAGQALTVTRTDKITNGTPNGTTVHNQARVAYATGAIVKATDITTHQ